MQDNDLIGNIVYSRAGRDKGNYYVIISVIDSDFVLIADGKYKTMEKPKKKKVKHLQITNEVAYDLIGSIKNNDSYTDSKIKKLLKQKALFKEV